MKTKVDKRYMCSRYLGFDEEWGTWSTVFFLLKIGLTVFFCINSRGLMSDLLVFPHRGNALKYG